MTYTSGVLKVVAQAVSQLWEHDDLMMVLTVQDEMVSLFYLTGFVPLLLLDWDLQPKK